MKTKRKFPSLLKSAITYVKRGFFVVPVPVGNNHPTIKGWPRLRLRFGQLKEAFVGAGGIGMLLKPSKLLDVDIDCPEALIAGEHFLPATEMVQGRDGNPRSHRYFQRNGKATKNHSFEDPRKRKDRRAVLIELRVKGKVTIVPPS